VNQQSISAQQKKSYKEVMHLSIACLNTPIGG
jgi:hypothetical protein